MNSNSKQKLHCKLFSLHVISGSKVPRNADLFDTEVYFDIDVAHYN